MLKDKFILVLCFLFLRKIEVSLLNLQSNPYGFSLANNKSCSKGSNALDKSTNKAPHFPLCQDSPSIFQTLKLRNFESCNPFCSLLGVLIIYCQRFCKFDDTENIQIICDASYFSYTEVISVTLSSLGKSTVSTHSLTRISTSGTAFFASKFLISVALMSLYLLVQKRNLTDI